MMPTRGGRMRGRGCGRRRPGPQSKSSGIKLLSVTAPVSPYYGCGAKSLVRSRAGFAKRRCERRDAMSKVRLLVGTRKGAFVLTSDGKRESWKVEGPHFAGWETYHVAGSPVNPDRLYCSQSSGWFGQVMQRSDDGGESWTPVGNKFAYAGVAGTHQWYDGTAHPWEFKRAWHLEPSLTDADTVFAGVEDAALFKSTDGGESWEELAGLRGHGSGPHWQPGAGGMCLHTILLDPAGPAADVHCDLGGRGLPHVMTAARRGSRSTRACGRCISRSPMRRWATACTRWRCTLRDPTPCLCRSTGT